MIVRKLRSAAASRLPVVMVYLSYATDCMFDYRYRATQHHKRNERSHSFPMIRIIFSIVIAHSLLIASEAFCEARLNKPTNLYHLVIPSEYGMREISSSKESNPKTHRTDKKILAEFDNGITIEFGIDTSIQVYFNGQRLTSANNQRQIVFRQADSPTKAIKYGKNIPIGPYRGYAPAGAHYSKGGEIVDFSRRSNEIQVNYKLKDDQGEIIRTIRAVSFIVNGRKFDGFSEKIILRRHIRTNPLYDAATGTIWHLGGQLSNHILWQNAPYGHSGTSGFLKTPLTQLNSKQYYGSLLTGGQPFVSISNGHYSHIAFTDEIAPVVGRISRSMDGYHLFSFPYGFNKHNFELPRVIHLFSEGNLNRNAYLTISEGIRRRILKSSGFTADAQLPIANGSFNSRLDLKTITYKEFTAQALPALKGMHFKRVFIGDMKSGHTGARYYQRPFEWHNEASIEDVKGFIDACRKNGIQSIAWIPMCTADIASKVVKNHPEWVLIQKGGILGQITAAHYHKRPEWLYIFPASGYLDWAYRNLERLNSSIGLDGVFLDSYDAAARLINMGNPSSRYPVKELSEFAQKLRNRGITVYGEAWSPFLVSAFWYQDYIKPYKNNEFSLSGSSPFTNRPLSTFINYYKAVSYNVFPFFDIHPFISNQRTFYLNHDAVRAEVTETNRVVTPIIESFGTDIQVLEWEKGTYWLSKKGFAIFVYQPIERLEIKSDKNVNLSIHPLTTDQIPTAQKNVDIHMIMNIPGNTVIYGRYL